MAGMSVTVLCPAGRRVNVKVTPNTSVLQIIEEASLKQDLNPDHYDLKHLRRVLDSSSSVRHAGLPNRCQLEMVETTVPRSSASVTVHIATESGLRLVHDFPCSTTLWDILLYHMEHSDVGEHFLPSAQSQKEVVLVYAMQRIGYPELSTVTLRTLGIMSGKCMLRHSVQNMSSAGCQAHVSSALTRRSTSHPEEVEEKESKPAPCSLPVEENELQPKPSKALVKEHEVWAHGEATGSPIPSVPQFKEQQSDIAMEEGSEVPVLNPVVTPKEPMPTNQPPQSSTDLSAPMDLTMSTHTQEALPRVTKIGDHNAIVFSMADAPRTLTLAEDDAFFQLTPEEVKQLYKEQRKVLEELEEAPLMTKNMREMEESSKVLTALNRYPVTHLRIYFPDEHVIQASFKPTDTVDDVIKFLRPFLANPTEEFNLSTRHPQRTLLPSITLVAADCVPNARLYYGGVSSGPPYLSEETMAKKSSYSGACSSLGMQSTKTRPLGVKEDGYSLSEPSTANRREEEVSGMDVRPHTSARMTGAVPKVPKWFKVGK